MRTKQIAWWLWVLGTVLIVASWFGVVSYAIGWSGFGIGMVGSVYGWGIRLPPAQPQAEKPVDESSQSSELTIPEKALITLYIDTAALFRIRLIKSLVLIVISLSLLALS